MDSTTPSGPSPDGRYSQAGMSRPSWVGNRTSAGVAVATAATGCASVSQCSSPVPRSTRAMFTGRVPVLSSTATRRPSPDTDIAVAKPAGSFGTGRSAPVTRSRAYRREAPSTFTDHASTLRSAESSAISTSQSGVSSQCSDRSARSKRASPTKSRPASVRTRKLVSSSHDPAMCCHFRSEEHTSELQSRPHIVCRLLLETKTKDSRRKEAKGTQRGARQKAEEYMSRLLRLSGQDVSRVYSFFFY